MSDYEDLIPSEDVIKERGASWLKMFEKFETNVDSEPLLIADIPDYEENERDQEPMCEETSDEDDDDFNVDEIKDKVLEVAEKRRKIYFDKGLFEKLNFFNGCDGNSMNFMQSNFSQNFFGHTSVSHHRQEVSVFHFTNNVQSFNGQMSFSNYFNNSSAMQNQPHLFNPLMRNHSLQAITGIPSVADRDSDFRQRSVSTDSFRKNDRNTNLRAIENVVEKDGLSYQSEGERTLIKSPSDSSSDYNKENRSQRRNRVKKTKRFYNAKTRKGSPEAIRKVPARIREISPDDKAVIKEKIGKEKVIKKEPTIYEISSDSDRPVLERVAKEKPIIYRSEKKNSEPIEGKKTGSQRRIKKIISSSDSDKTITEELPARHQSKKKEHSSMNAGTSQSFQNITKIKSSKIDVRDLAKETNKSRILPESDPDQTLIEEKTKQNHKSNKGEKQETKSDPKPVKKIKFGDRSEESGKKEQKTTDVKKIKGAEKNLESSGSDHETEIKKAGKNKTKPSKTANTDLVEKKKEGSQNNKKQQKPNDVKKNKRLETSVESSGSDYEAEKKEKIRKQQKLRALSVMTKNRSAEKNVDSSQSSSVKPNRSAEKSIASSQLSRITRNRSEREDDSSQCSTVKPNRSAEKIVVSSQSSSSKSNRSAEKNVASSELSNEKNNRSAEKNVDSSHSKNETLVKQKEGKTSANSKTKKNKSAEVTDGYETEIKKKRGRPLKPNPEKNDSSQSNNGTVVEKKGPAAKNHTKNNSKEKESHIIVNSTGLSDLTGNSSKRFDENSISSFDGMSTIKPQQKREQILIHRPILGDTSTITLMRGELNNRFGSKLTDEILGRRHFLTFKANSEVLYEPAVAETSPELIESDDDVFLHLTSHLGKIIVIRHK